MIDPRSFPDAPLDPPAEVEVLKGDCVRCHGSGQCRPQGLGGAWSDCPACDGTGQVEIPPAVKEFEKD